MDPAFILPLPKASWMSGVDESATDPKKKEALYHLQAKLGKVRSGKMTWDEFLRGVDLADPALRIAATREGDTVLHLAVTARREEVLAALGRDPILSSKRNDYGLTPCEISQFLNREPATASFHTQPKVAVEDEEKHPSLLKIVFLSHPIFETDRVFDHILSRSHKAKLDDQIPPEKIWMGIYFDKEIQKGTHPPVSIRFIDDEVGFGVFTTARIPPCAYVGEYTGLVCERKRKHLKHKYYCVRYTVPGMGQRTFVIDAEEGGNFTRFINHSENPNLSLQSVYWRGLPRMVFIALKEIPEGSQLTFDYGTFFWKECHQIPKLLV